MIDFKIKRGLSTDLFIEPGRINPRLIIEEGCWYLCTDTAELFLGVSTEDGLALKRINGSAADKPTNIPGTGEGELITRSIIDAFINEETGMLHLVFSDDTDDVIIPAVGKDGADGKDGLTTAVKVNGKVYEHKDGVIELPDFLTEHQDLSDYAKSKTVVKQKYEVLPFEGAIINYTDNEVRVNTQYVDISALPPQQAGDGSSDKYYYMTFRAYAPEGATSVIEGSNDKMDAEHSTLATDSFGRKYTTIWAAIASKNGDTWSKFGDSSTVDKYLGFYYNFHWYKDDVVVGKDKVRVILTNDACHNDLVPDAVARRIDDKIKTIKVPSIEGLATEEFVREEIDTKLLDIKANDVPFTSAKFVAKAFGGFAVGDDLNGLTVAQLFAKLLELTDVKPGENPEDPEVPGEDATPEEIIEYLVIKQATMYSQDEAGNLVETPFASNTWTKEEAAVKMNGVSTIYQIEDEFGTVIESGYQEATDFNEEAWLTVALPSEIKNVKVKMYDSDVNDWVEMNWKVVPAEEQTMEGYTIWTVPEDYEVMSGDTYRFVIVE